MADFDYAAVLPTLPPEGTMEAAMKKGAFKHQRLVYRVEYYTDPLTGVKEKGVRVTCTGCGESWIAEYVDPGEGCCHGHGRFGFVNQGTDETVTDGNSTLCPMCGAEARVVHIRDMNNGSGCATDEVWVMTAGRHEDKLVLFGWLLQRRTYKDGHVEYGSDPYEAYVVERKKIVRLMGYQKIVTSVRMLHHWEQRKTFLDFWGADGILNFDPETLVGSTAENSALGAYLDANKTDAYPVSYLALWQKHPQLENLVVQGAAGLLGEMIESERRSYYYSRTRGTLKLEQINWKEKRPAAMLGLSKPDFRTVVRERVDSWSLKVCKELMEAEHLQCEECIRLIRAIGATSIHSLLCQTKSMRGQSVTRILRYCEKQKAKPEILLDYWSMARELGEDPERNRFPKDVKREHDRVMRELQNIKDAKRAAEERAKTEARREKFAEAVAHYAEMAWDQGDIFIRAVACEEELIEESKQLDHCVKNYAQKIADGKTMIFFIRRTAEPEKSWYTLELLPDGTVSQNRGYKNCGKTEEVQEFEDAWAKWMRKQKQMKEKNTA